MSDVGTRLAREVEEFVEAQDIYCVESIYQTDHAIQNAYEFIERLCDIVGYKKDEE